MKLSRLARRIVAGITGLMLLLSLTAAAANACILSAVGPQDAVMSEPNCESPAQVSVPAAPGCYQEHYLSQQTTPATAESAALASVEPPMIVARLDPLFLTECGTAAATSSPLHASFPPPHTLFCRLRN
jgi:hypothetical protein